MSSNILSRLRQTFSSRSPLLRVVVWLVIGLFAIFVLYVVGINIFLKTGGLSSTLVKAAPEVRDMKLEGAYSPYPGHVSVDRFVLKFEDSSIQFQLTIDNLVVDVDLFALAARKFHASDVRGNVSFLMAEKVLRAKDLEARLEAFPRIEGLKYPPLKRRKEEDKDDDPDTWAVLLENVDVTANEVWIMEYRYEGNARVAGLLDIRPQRRLRVDSGRVELKSGKLSVGKSATLVASVEGQLEATVFEHDPDGIGEKTMLDYLTASMNLDARGIELEQAARLYPALGAYRPESDEARLSVRGKLKRGKLTTGTRAELHAPKMAATAGPVRVSGALNATGAYKNGGSLSATMSSKSLTLSAKKAQKVDPPTLTDIQIETTLRGDHLTGAWSLNRARLAVGQLDVPALAWLNAPLDTQLFRSGRAQGSLDVTRHPSGTLKGDVKLNADRATITVGDTPLTLSGSVHAAETATGAKEGYEVERIRVQLDDIIVGDDAEYRWWLSAVSRNARVSTDGTVEATFDIGAQSLEPLIPLLIKKKIVQTAARAFLDLDDTEGTVTLDRSKKRLRVTVDRLKSGNFSTRGTLLKKNGHTCGAFFVDGPLVEVGVEIRPVSGVSVTPFVDPEWLEKALRRPCRADGQNPKNEP